MRPRMVMTASGAVGAAIGTLFAAGLATGARAETPRAERTLAELAQATTAAACDVAACTARYRSFRASDCTFQPYQGPRRLCTVGDPQPRAAPTEGAAVVGAAASPPQDAAAPAPAAEGEAGFSEPADAPPPQPSGPPRAASTVSAAGDVIDGWIDVAVLGAFGVFWALAYVRLWRGPPREGVAQSLQAPIHRGPARR